MQVGIVEGEERHITKAKRLILPKNIRENMSIETAQNRIRGIRENSGSKMNSKHNVLFKKPTLGKKL